MPKRRLIGKITSVKMHETALVTVDRMKIHPLYGKRYRRTSVFAVHNPDNTYNLADLVEIEEHRPISKTKNWIIRGRVGKGVTAPVAGLEEAVSQVIESTPEESAKE